MVRLTPDRCARCRAKDPWHNKSFFLAIVGGTGAYTVTSRH
jgi:hypothetical protein